MLGKEKFSAPYTAIIAEELVPFASWIEQVDSSLFSGKTVDELCCTLCVTTANSKNYTATSSSESFETALFKALSTVKRELTQSLLPKRKKTLREVLPFFNL